jgi:hypothetical protein
MSSAVPTLAKLGDMSKALAALERDLPQAIEGDRTGFARPARVARGRERWHSIAAGPSVQLQPQDAVNAGIDMELATRRTLLSELGSAQGILEAASKKAAKDPVSQALVTLLQENAAGALPGPVLATQQLVSRSDLSARAVAANWLRDIVPGIASVDAIEEQIARADLKLPLEKLVERGFVGREEQLRALDDYVDVIGPKDIRGALSRALERARRIFSQSPPIVISGPGGVGKSTLVARFILDHLREQERRPFPFAYLDFDRASVRSRDPASALAELIRQLAVQFPAMADSAEERISFLRQGRRSHDFAYSSKDTRDLGFAVHEISGTFGRYLPPKAPVLVVLDTFEEVQYLGDGVVAAYLDAFGLLYSLLPGMRLVISGRSPVGDELIQTHDIKLEGFNPQEAEVFLHSYVSRRDPHAKDGQLRLTRELALAATRGSLATPLTLVLAGDALVRSYAGGSSDSPEKLLRFVRRIKKNQLQEGLYGRILDHLHDRDLKKIAHPGLVLRRIDADILMHVLAPARRLRITNNKQAEDLIDLLSREGALVEPDPRGGVRHRPDVRKLMLSDLTVSEKKRARSIEQRAAKYYGEKFAETGALDDLAEQIYHFMRIETEPLNLELMWRHGVEPYLANALDEVPPRQKIWLAGKLQLGVDKGTRAAADQTMWELDTERSVRQLLSYGTQDSYARAKSLIFERPPPSWRRDGTMHLLAAEVLMASADFQTALDILGEIKFEIPTAEHQAKRILLTAQAAEAMGEPHRALEEVANGERLRGQIDVETELRLLLTHLRLVAQMAPYGGFDEDDGEVGRLRNAALILIQSQPPNFLQSAPGVLRDAAAEFGADHPPLLKLAMKTLGLQLIDNDVIYFAIEAIEQWDSQVRFRKGELSPDGEVVSLIGELTGGEDLLEWFRENRGRAADRILKLWTKYCMPLEVRKRFAALYSDVSRRSSRREAAFA